MVTTFALCVIVTAVALAARLLRSHGGACIPAWFLIASVCFVNVGFLAIHFRSGAQPWISSAEGLTVVSTGLLTATIAVLIIHPRHDSSQRSPDPATSSSSPTLQDRRLLWLTFTLLAPAWLYFALLGTVPLFDGISAIAHEGVGGLGELQASRLARDPYASQHGERVPLQGLLQMFRNFGAPVVFVYALLQLRQGMQRNLRYGVMLLAVVTSVAAGQRWPLMYLAMAAILAFCLTTARFPAKQVLSGISVSFILGAALSAMQARTLDNITSVAAAVQFGVADLVDRIFIYQALVPMASYGSAGDSLRGMMGASYAQSLWAYLPGPGASFPVDFYRIVTGDVKGYTAPPDLYTEAYFNFGYLGVILLTSAWAALLCIVDRSRGDDLSDATVKAGLGSVLVFSAFSGPMMVLGAAGVCLAGLLVLRCLKDRSPELLTGPEPRRATL